jgi:hypothetical protein
VRRICANDVLPLKTVVPFLMIVSAMRGIGRQRFLGDQHPWTECARAVVHLRLRQIERVLAFDVARAHVVADRVADDRPPRLITSASSGSGTLHRASRRMHTGSPGPRTRQAAALKNSSGRSAEYTAS